MVTNREQTELVGPKSMSGLIVVVFLEKFEIRNIRDPDSGSEVPTPGAAPA